MSAEILDGRAIRDQILEEAKEKLAKLKEKPTLSIILVGNDPASTIYIREKDKATDKIGAEFRLIKKPSFVEQGELEGIIKKLNNDSKVRGIVVQKPLPKHINEEKIDKIIATEKDVDGLNPASNLYSTTAKGVIELLKRYKIKIEGKDATVVGRSKLTGLPIALLLLEENATVTVCHKKTRNLKGKTLVADILIAAAGVPKLIRADMVKPGAIVIDVGTTRIRGTKKLIGDVDFEEVKRVASFISPVPGGVGPMTVAGLMMNLVQATTK